ncbi:hypothetical protein PHYSODRAFT_342736 [Phytophthora sojae]|uniref:Uncharacterized protein n=2 Tax=Phytophthora sojae (strain P6497) TaxID=1094619 RepID=G5AHG8_PHYSP|nr:hypothetical protein PHYSODRAFT_342736 [Phytophthora sojae]EGZ05010.1 hypothetical protein PHYSODRAFT_342736 [Phytophthora sojae]|eukprot:XP_009539519.1 hypothetical protein PHYSODRAFT_342736 [Phytophthora sojae]
MRGHIAISQIINMAESVPSDGKQATVPAQGTAPPCSAPPPTQQRTGDAPANTAPAGGGGDQAGNSASSNTSAGVTRTGETKRVSFSGDAGKTSDANMREADGTASADAAAQETGDANSESKAPDAGDTAADVNLEDAPEFKLPRHATLEDVRGLVFAGMLRQQEVDVPDFVLPVHPPHWTLPTPPDLKTNAYLVGVPGIVNDIRAGAFAMEGYGGASTLIGFEELSDENLQGLKEVCGANAGIDVLCPRRSPLSAFELDNTLNSIGIRREMASLLRHFNSTRLAERVFKMTGYLRRVLGAYRNMRSLADSQQGFTATQEVVDTRRKYKELKRTWKFTCDYWFLEVQEALGKVDDAESKYKVALGEQKTRYQDEIDSLESEKAQLKARLADSEAQVRILKSRLELATVDPWKFPDFLQEHTDFTGNWERLHDLFNLCIKDSKPPESWDTVINVTAMDKRKAAAAPYPEKSTRMPPSSGSGSSVVLKFWISRGSKNGQGSRKSRDSEVPKTQSNSASPQVHKVQRRPKDHQPGRDSVRRAGEKTVVSKEAAHTMLPGGVVWKEVRPDVRQAILAGLKYDTAMEWIGSDRAAHRHFRQPQLIKMLVSAVMCHHPGGTSMAHMVYPDEDADSTVDDIENDPDYQPPAQEPEESASSSSSEEEEEAAEGDDDAEDDDNAEDDNGVEEPLEVKPPAKRPRSESSKEPQGSNSKSKKKRRTGNKKDTSATQGSSGTQGSKATSRSKHPSALARKSYSELTSSELMTAEDPEDNETSWRIYGVLVQYPSSTKSASCQTPGFPEYEIHKYSYDVVHERWDREAYQEVLDSEPWETMLQGRFRVFYFHERELLSAKALKLLEVVVDAMHKHAQAIWERGHWVPIPTEEQADATMDSQRKSRRNALRRAYKALVERSHNTPGFIPSLWHEPSLWKFPDKCCYWIWGDPRAKKLGGAKCKDLDVQLATLDIREPSRVQWNTAADDDEWLQYVPNNIKRHIKPLAIRKLNPLSLKHS